MSARSALRFGPHLKELRVHCCQTSPESQGVRDFVNKYYTDLKGNNPTLPILIRECSGIQPKIWARYDFGKEAVTPVSGLKAEDVLKEVEKLATSSS